MAKMPMPVYVPEPQFKGLGVMPEASAKAEEAVQPLAQAYGAIEQQKISHEQKVKAQQFTRLLATGVEGMGAYATEVAAKYPDLGRQFATEIQTFAPLFQDPNLTGDKAREIYTGIYDSFNRRVQERDKQAHELTPEQKAQAELNMHRKKKEIDQEFEDAKPPRPASDFDKRRMREMADSKKMLNVIWSKIDNEWKKQPEKEMDPEGFATWQKGMKDLQRDLNDLEIKAGYPATRNPFHDERRQSKSWLEYAATVNDPAYKKAVGAASSATAKNANRAQVSGALAWLNNPANKSSEKREAVIAKLKSLGVTSGF